MESSERACCAIGCGNQGVLPFPKNEVVRKKWELALGRQNWKATVNSRLCTNHFKRTDFIQKEVVASNGLKLVTKILKKGVIPSICYKNCNILREIKPKNLETLKCVKNIPRILKKCKSELNKHNNIHQPIVITKKQVDTDTIQHNVKNMPRILNEELQVQKPIQCIKKAYKGPNQKLFIPLHLVTKVGQGSNVSEKDVQKITHKSNVTHHHQMNTSYPFRVADAEDIEEKNEMHENTQKSNVTQSGYRMEPSYPLRATHAKEIEENNKTNKKDVKCNAKEDVTLVMEVEEEVFPEIEYLDMEDFCTEDSELSPEKQSSSSETNTNSSGAPKIETEPQIDSNDIAVQLPIHTYKIPSNNNLPSRFNINQRFVRVASTQVKECELTRKVAHKEPSQGNQPIYPNTAQSPSKSILQIIKPAITTVNTRLDTKPPTVPDINTKADAFLYYNKEKEKLREKLKMLRKEYCRYDTLVKQRKTRLNKLKNFMTHPEFLKCTGKFAPIPKILSTCQLRLASKRSKGRRFNEEEKKLAKSLFEKNPSAYRFMIRIGFALPSMRTLKEMQNPVGSSEGCDEAIKRLKEKVNALKPMQRLCTLMFKEEILRPENRKQKIITSFGDNENEVTLEADHALLFMVRSITTRYKEPVSYTFSYGPTSETDLAVHIKNVISDLQVLGLKVVATVCAHTDTNRRAIQILINEASCDSLMSGRRNNENVFIVNSQPIVTIFDPPHLLRGIRNHFMSKDLMYVLNGRSKVARWSYLEMVVKENLEINGERPIPKLTEELVYPTKDVLNETKCAAQVFSQTVASYMGYLAGRAILPPESQDTADLLLFFDQLFDSVNGFLANTNRKGKPLLYACKTNSPHSKKWRECIQVLQTMNFLENGCSVEVPELECWIWTLRSFELLTKRLNNDYNVPKVWTRYLNQDVLERVFRMVVNPHKKKKHKKVSSKRETTKNDVNELPEIVNTSDGDKEVVTQNIINIPCKKEYIIHWDGKVTEQQSVPRLPIKENLVNSNNNMITQKVIRRPNSSHKGRKVVKQYGQKGLKQPKIENSSECQRKVTQKHPKSENLSAARVEEFISQNTVSKLPSLPMLEI